MIGDKDWYEGIGRLVVFVAWSVGTYFMIRHSANVILNECVPAFKRKDKGDIFLVICIIFCTLFYAGLSLGMIWVWYSIYSNWPENENGSYTDYDDYGY